jgi:hypothetical protein
MLERFMDKVSPEPNSGCWLWMAAVSSNGYGHFSTGKKARPEPAHRVAYKLFCGEIPEGQIVRHKCDVPSCVNPDHLLVGTHKDNSRDSHNRGRAALGPRHGNTRLTADQVIFARNRDLTVREIADTLGCGTSTVQAIRDGRTWSHLEYNL